MRDRGLNAGAVEFELEFESLYDNNPRIFIRMTSSFIPAKDVISPKAHWALIDVVADLGPDNIAVAVGRWDGNPVLAMRWNGGATNRLGNPQSRGLPTWFVLPSGRYTEAIIALVPAEKQALVRNFIPAS